MSVVTYFAASSVVGIAALDDSFVFVSYDGSIGSLSLTNDDLRLSKAAQLPVGEVPVSCHRCGDKAVVVTHSGSVFLVSSEVTFEKLPSLAMATPVIATSLAGAILVAVSEEGECVACDLRLPAERVWRHQLPTPPAAAIDLVDESTLVVADLAGQLWKVNITDGDSRPTALLEDCEPTSAVAAHPFQSSVLALCLERGAVKIVEFDQNTVVSSTTIEVSDSPITTARFHPRDAHQLVTAAFDGSLTSWTLASTAMGGWSSANENQLTLDIMQPEGFALPLTALEVGDGFVIAAMQNRIFIVSTLPDLDNSEGEMDALR